MLPELFAIFYSCMDVSCLVIKLLKGYLHGRESGSHGESNPRSSCDSFTCHCAMTKRELPSPMLQLLLASILMCYQNSFQRCPKTTLLSHVENPCTGLAEKNSLIWDSYYLFIINNYPPTILPAMPIGRNFSSFEDVVCVI